MGMPAVPAAASAAPAGFEQAAFDDLGTPLAEVTFLVVDLETTGGAPVDAGITEIGAVKVRGGELVGQYQTLVNPGIPIPPFVAALTGITDALVATAPALRAVLPGFLEFARGAVLVAHNAPYDVGFLKAACARFGHPWPDPPVVDTARLARVALLRDEVPNCKLGTLAAFFRASVAPTHRAFDDARATADVLHGLLERVGGLGVRSLEDLRAFTGRVSAAQRTKRHLADGLPDAPGVYVFQDARGEALYIGTSTSIRTRVRSYFTASEQRRRMAEMVRIAERVVPIVCATPLEARVRELRLIASAQPRYNRRSRRPEAQRWLKLTAEAAPRLSIVGTVGDDAGAGARYLGPFPSRSSAQEAAEALALAYPVRGCTSRLARRPRALVPCCALAELGRCLAPCSSAGDHEGYAGVVDALREAMSGDLRQVVAAVHARMSRLSTQERFEEAARWRERLACLAGASLRTHRLAGLGSCAELVAAQAAADHGWDIHVIRHGRLAAAGRAAPGIDPRPMVAALRGSAEHVEPRPTPMPGGLPDEAAELLRWLDSPGVRLVHSDSALSVPLHCGGDLPARLGQARLDWVTGWERESRSRPLGPVEPRPATRMLIA